MDLAPNAPAALASVEERSALAQLASEQDFIARMERLPWTKKHWGVASVLFTSTLMDGYDGTMMGAALPLIVAALGISLQQGGVLIGAAFFGQMFGSFTAGILAERFGRRTVLMVSCVIMGVCAIAAALAQDLNSLIAARAVQGLGIGAEIPIAGALFNEFVRGKNRGFAVVAYEGGFSWGALLAPVLGLAVAAWFGANAAWHAMFAFAALSVLIVFARNRLLPESPRWLISKGRTAEAEKVVEDFEASARRGGKALDEPVVVAAPRAKKTNYLELFSREYRLRTITNWITWGTAYSYAYGFGSFLATAYVTVGGLPVTSALALTIVTSLIGLCWIYTYGYLFDRIGRKRLIWGGLLWSSVWLVMGAILSGPLGLTSWPVLLLIGTMVTLGTSPATAGGYVYTPEQFPTRMRAWALSTCTTWIRAVSTVMPIAMGFILTSALGLTGAWVVSSIPLLFGALWLMKFGIETKGRVLEEIAA